MSSILLPCRTCAACALFASLILAGCETTPPPAPPPPPVAAVAPEAVTPEPVAEPEPEPVIESAAELPLQTMSAPRRGDTALPFDFVNQNARVGLLRNRLGEPSIFPLNSTGGNVAFYQDVVGLPKLEVQELDDGRIRIWVRVLNRANRDIAVRVQCVAAIDEQHEERRAYQEVIFERDVYRDFSFILAGPKDRRFTILVRENG